MDLVASLIEEADFAASLGNTLYQLARRIERVEFSQAGRKLVDEMLDQISDAMEAITGDAQGRASVAANVPAQLANIANFRQRCLKLGAEMPSADRGAFLALLGSAERAYLEIERIDAERRSVSRVVNEEQADAAVIGNLQATTA